MVNAPRPAWFEVVDTQTVDTKGRFAGDYMVLAMYVERRPAQQHVDQLNRAERDSARLLGQLRKSMAANDRRTA